MKDRLILVILIVILWTFLVLLQYYVPFVPSVSLILLFMVSYCFLLALGQALNKNKIDKNLLNKDYFPYINVLVPAHNEGVVLQDTIENLVNIDYPNYDILIIDDRSTDNTLDIAKLLSEKYKGRVNFYSRNTDAFPGKSAVLNDVLTITNGELICVFDSDARVKPDFLSCIVPYMEKDNVAALQVRKVISNKDKNILTKCQHYEYCMDSYIQLGRNSLEGAVELRGNGQIIKRKALKNIGGFNNYTVTDDLDLSTRLHLAGYDIRFCFDTCVKEEGVESIKSIINQRKRWAEGGIRRYLENFIPIISSKKLSFRVSLDMLAYFSEFVLPIWLISDIIIQLINILLGAKPHIFTNFIIISGIFLFFVLSLVASLRKFEDLNLFETLKWAVITSIYLITLWTVVVCLVVLKIIFKPKSNFWYKPKRVGAK